MERLTREQSRERTRCRLLTAAELLFARDGYVATSVDRIVEEAGFTKGAFYSNFESKEQIFLAVFERHGRADLAELLARLDACATPAAIIDAITHWADARAGHGNWSMAVIEYGRQARGQPEVQARLATVLRGNWEALGSRLVPLLRVPGAEAAALGGLVFELVHAPAMGFVSAPSAGTLVRLALGGLCRTDG